MYFCKGSRAMAAAHSIDRKMILYFSLLSQLSFSCSNILSLFDSAGVEHACVHKVVVLVDQGAIIYGGDVLACELAPVEWRVVALGIAFLCIIDPVLV